MQKFFNRFGGQRAQKENFSGWPLPSYVRQIPIVEPGTFQSLKLSSYGALNPEKYANALVIGLGATGSEVLQIWLKSLAQDPAGPQHSLRAVLITDRPVKPLDGSVVNVRQFDLSAGRITANITGSFRSQREQVNNLFRQVANYRPFEEFLHVCLIEQHQGLQIFVVGSALEYEIGLLGPVLQAIRLAGEASIGPRDPTINTLITTASPFPAQGEGEFYATLREIGRFTFSGIQWMEPPAGTPNGAVHSALIDHVILVESAGSTKNAPDLSRMTFDNGVGRVLGEALFYLIHPASRLAMDDFNRSASAQIRSQTHKPVVHSLGIATLQVPFEELTDYAATRLIRAVLFGENEHRLSEGIVSRSSDPSQIGEDIQVIATQWLESGPSEHPFFHWLLQLDGPGGLSRIPKIGPEFKSAFRSQLAWGLTKTLNQPGMLNRFTISELVMNWLARRLDLVEEWLHQTNQRQYEMAEVQWFQDFLDDARKNLQLCQSEVKKWEGVFYPLVRESFRGEFAQSRRNQNLSSSGSWWNDADSGQSKPFDESKLPKTEDSQNLQEYFRNLQSQSELNIKKAAGGQISRSILANPTDELKEAKAFYENTVRPEISSSQSECSRAFLRLRERMGWWMRLDDSPHLLFICAPAEVDRLDEQIPLPQATLWNPDQKVDLVKLLLGLSRIQVTGLSEDFLGIWLREKFIASARFLHQAVYPFIQYDQQKAAQQFLRSSRQYYLIGRDKALTGECRSIVFPNVADVAIQECGEGEPGRLTAMTIEFNIPLEMVESLRKAYTNYAHQESFHLYPQEQIAVRYERRIRSYQKWEELSPELAAILVDTQRISLFCQALFTGLIAILPDEMGHERRWTVLALNEHFKPFPLTSVGSPYALLDAMRAFVLEKPSTTNLESQFSSPFHPSHYKEYLDLLWREAHRRRQSVDFYNQREQFSRTHLNDWKVRGEQDALARGFANILRVELEEPVWKDW